MATIQMTSGSFNPQTPTTQVTIFSDSDDSTLQVVTVKKHDTPVPNGTITTDLSTAVVYMSPGDFSALVSCLEDSSHQAVITLTYSGTTVTGTSMSCNLKAA